MRDPDVLPPIPRSLEHRPTIGGAVVPFVNVQLAGGGVDFRSQDQGRATACWASRRCQVCGMPIDPPIVLVGGPDALAQLVFGEAPMHPECLVYVSRACPMVAGRMAAYPDRETLAAGARGEHCGDPACSECGERRFWTPTPGTDHDVPGGEPAHAWYAVWVRDYTPAGTRGVADAVTNGVVDPAAVIRVVLISAPGEGRVWRRIPTGEALAGYAPPELSADPELAPWARPGR